MSGRTDTRIRCPPTAGQQPGHDEVLAELARHLAQRSARQVPLGQQRIRRIGLGSREQPDRRVPVPDPQPGGLIPFLAAGEPVRHLEHQLSTARPGGRCRPRALPARLNRLTHVQ